MTSFHSFWEEVLFILSFLTWQTLRPHYSVVQIVFWPKF